MIFFFFFGVHRLWSFGVCAGGRFSVFGDQ